MLNLTDSAVARIREVLSGNQVPNPKLRIFVEGGGCSGFQYGFMIEEDNTDDDFVISVQDISVLVDPVSAQYVDGITIDFKDDLNGARFVMNNPNAVTTCGCGSSFSPY
jgi:iron-sulfur cluster insertion protein